VSAYPGYLRPVVQLVPLYHGVALSRAAAFGDASWGSTAFHLGFLVVMAVSGIAWGRHTMQRRLVD
jgi:lipooligosaccharide transport system permease protein